LLGLDQAAYALSDFAMRRSSHRLATKRSLDDAGPKSKLSSNDESSLFHRPKAGDTAQNNDCGVLPGE